MRRARSPPAARSRGNYGALDLVETYSNISTTRSSVQEVTMRRILAPSAALLAVALGLGACATGASLPKELDQFRRVSGGASWSGIEAIESRGTIAAGGLTGSYEALEDVRG